MAGTEIGWAGLGIIPTFDKFGSQLDKGTSKAMVAAGASGGQKFGTAAGRSAGSRFGTTFRTAAKASLIGLIGLGAGAVKLGGDAIGLASDLNESLNAVNVSYGKQSKAVKRLGRDAADSLGLSNEEFNSLAVRFSGFSKKIAGGDGTKVVKTLDDLTHRASDFASVMNLEVNDAAELFQSGLAGETEPLRRFGIDMSAAKVQAFAYSEGIAKAGSTLTEGQKVQARYKLLMQQTQKTQGDFANTSDQMANRQRILNARWDDARAKLGKGLLPIVNDFIGFVTDDALPVVEDFSDWFTRKGIPAIKDFGDEMRPLAKSLLPAAGDALGIVADGVKKAAPFAKDMVDAFNDMPKWVQTVLVGGGAAAFGAKKLGLTSLLGGRKSGGLGGGLLGGISKATPLPVYVVNGAGGAGGLPDVLGGPEGKPSGGKPGRFAGIKGGALNLLALVGGAGASLGGIRKLDHAGEVVKFTGDLKKANAELATFALQRTGITDVEKAFGRLDSVYAKLTKHNPTAGFDKLRVLSQQTGVSMDDLRAILPRTSKAIDDSGRSADNAADKTREWKRTILDVPKAREVKITTPGADEAIRKLQTVRQAAIDAGKPVKVHVATVTPGGFAVEEPGTRHRTSGRTSTSPKSAAGVQVHIEHMGVTDFDGALTQVNRRVQTATRSGGERF